MESRWKILIVVLALALALPACDQPLSQAPAQPGEPPASPAAQAQLAQGQSPTAIPPAPVFLPSPEIPQPSESPAPHKPDFSGVVISVADLPEGFQEVESSSQAKIGLTQENLGKFFEGIFTQARPANYFAFINGSATDFEMLMGMIFIPLDETDQASFDQEFSDPAQAAQVFSASFGAPAELIQGGEPVGDKSAGFTFVAETGGQKLRGDLLIGRRGSAALVILVFYQDGKRPPFEAARSASLLDQRLITALTR